jgi:shikimate kinase
MIQLIILRGYPGSGKTTIGKALEKRGVGKFIDHNEILTFIAKISGDDDGIYDDIASLEKAITRKLLKSNKTVIIARGFSHLRSLEPYIQTAEKLGVQAKVIRLNVDYHELAQRVTSSDRKSDFNPTTDADSLTKWVRENPITNYPDEIIIDNLRPIDEVVSSIITQI